MGGMLSSESTQDLPAEMPKEKKKDSKKDSKASKGTKQQKTSSSSTTSVSIPLAPLLDNVEVYFFSDFVFRFFVEERIPFYKFLSKLQFCNMD